MATSNFKDEGMDRYNNYGMQETHLGLYRKESDLNEKNMNGVFSRINKSVT